MTSELMARPEPVDDVLAAGRRVRHGVAARAGHEDEQQLLEAARPTAAEAVVEGRAGGGAVTVRVTGGMVFQSVAIAAEVVDPAEARAAPG